MAGSRLFLMGMGPSLNNIDFDKLRGEEVWTTGRIDILCERENWSPTRHFYGDIVCREYHVQEIVRHITDPYGPYEYWIRWDTAELINGIWSNEWTDKDRHLLPLELGMRDEGRDENNQSIRKWYPELSEYPHVHVWDACWHHLSAMTTPDGTPRLNFPSGWHLGWEKEVGVGNYDPEFRGSRKHTGLEVCRYGCTMNALLQIAFVEGYNPVYTIGTDLGFRYRPGERGQPLHNPDEDHYCPNYHNVWEREDYCIRRNPTHELVYQHALQWYREHGRLLFNASKGGYLEALPRVDFDSLFDKPEYEDLE